MAAIHQPIGKTAVMPRDSHSARKFRVFHDADTNPFVARLRGPPETGALLERAGQAAEEAAVAPHEARVVNC
jgi:hypothetical protein